MGGPFTFPQAQQRDPETSAKGGEARDAARDPLGADPLGQDPLADGEEQASGKVAEAHDDGGAGSLTEDPGAKNAQDEQRASAGGAQVDVPREVPAPVASPEETDAEKVAGEAEAEEQETEQVEEEEQALDEEKQEAPAEVDLVDPSVPSPGEPDPEKLGDPVFDAVVHAATGMRAPEHVAEITGGVEELFDTGEQVVQSVRDEAETSLSAFERTTEQSRSTFDASVTASQQGLSQGYEQAASTVTEATEAARASLSTQATQEQERISGAAASARQSVRGAHERGAAELEARKVEWKGSVEASAQALADELRSWGAAKKAEVLSLARDDEAKGKALGSKKKTENAFAAKKALARAERYEACAPEFERYAEIAAQHCESIRDEADLLGDNLLVPTIDSLYPLAEQHEERVEKEKAAYNAAVEKSAQGGEARLTELQKREVENYGEQDDKAQQVVDDAHFQYDHNLEQTRKQVETWEKDEINALQQDTEEHLERMDDMTVSTRGLPPAPEAQEQIDEAKGVLEEREDTVRVVLDEGTTVVCQKIETRTEEQKSRVTEALDSKQAEAIASADQTATKVQGQVEQIGQGMADEGSRAAERMHKTRSGGVEGAHSAVRTADREATAYEDRIVARLEQYRGGVEAQMLDLASKMANATQVAEETAGSELRADLKNRAQQLERAIDGPGTDEASVIRNLSGLSPAEVAALDDRYRGITNGYLEGESLWNDVWYDLEEGDDPAWKPAKAMLKGDTVRGAKLALEYTYDEGSSFLWGPDTELANDVMNSLNEDDRNELVDDPDFPRIREEMIEAERQHQQAWVDAVTLGFTGPVGPSGGHAVEVPDEWVHTYELDTFLALSDENLSFEDAHLEADAIAIEEACNGGWLFGLGTDEQAIYDNLEGKTDEQRAKLEQLYEGYTGNTLDSELDDELSGLDEERADFLMDGDEVGAKMIAIEMGLDDEDETAVFGELEDPNLQSGDWFAQQSAKQDREELNLRWQDRKGESLNTSLREGMDDEHEGAQDIALHDLWGEEAPFEAQMTYAMQEGSGADQEEYAKKAAEALQAEMAELPPDERMEYWIAKKQWFADQFGITDLERHLGIGKHLFDRQVPHAIEDGQTRYELHRGLVEALGDEYSVHDVFRLAQLDWEWYRGRGGGGGGTAMGWMGYESGEILDEQFKELQLLYSQADWFDQDTGHPDGDPESLRKWKHFQELAENLNQQSEVYDQQRNDIADAVTMVIKVVAAIVATVATAGFGAGVGVALLINAGGGLLSIAVKSSMQGAAYSSDEAMKDLAIVMAEAAVGAMASGLGPFKGYKNFLNKIDDAGKFWPGVMKDTLTELPTEMLAVIADPATWEDPLAESLALGFSALAISFVGRTANKFTDDAFTDLVSNRQKDLMLSFVNEAEKSLLDPRNWDKQGEEVAFAFLQSAFTEFVKTAAVQGAHDRIIQGIKQQGGITPGTAGRLNNLKSSKPDSFNYIMEKVQTGEGALGPSSIAESSVDWSPVGGGTSSTRGSSTGGEADAQTTTGVAQPSSLEVINSGTRAELIALPGIGEAHADRILNHRSRGLGFDSLDELEQVHMIGPATVAKLKEEDEREQLAVAAG